MSFLFVSIFPKLDEIPFLFVFVICKLDEILLLFISDFKVSI